MKKVLVMALTLVMAASMIFVLSGCGEVTLESMDVDGVTVSVPSDYDEFADEGEIYLAKGPDASIQVGKAQANSSKASQWDESVFDQLFGIYSDLKYSEVKQGTAPNGEDAVYATLEGTNEDGEVRDIRCTVLFDGNGYIYINYIIMAQGAESSTSENADAIMESFTITE